MAGIMNIIARMMIEMTFGDSGGVEIYSRKFFSLLLYNLVILYDFGGKKDRRLTQRTRLIPNGRENSHESPSNTVIAYTEKRSVSNSVMC
jgi:hypothetical protein